MPEKLLVLRHCGRVDPLSLDSYLTAGGFGAVRRLLTGCSPADVIAEIQKAGLRGRGGGGFPTGLKWEQVAQAPGPMKYVICNASEGETGAFKDRFILEGDPFSVIEGLAVSAFAVGASRACIYLRPEYARLAPGLTAAVAQAARAGWLKAGEGLRIDIVPGQGGYICGEETALMESLEGRRGEPRNRPPFPAIRGLNGFPTLINNVETLANVPWIVDQGWESFAGMGTDRSKGTKVFSISGDVERPGVYELEMGTPLRQLVQEIAGARDVKMVQLGGASGRVVPESGLDVALSYETMLGAGPAMVFNRSRSAVEIAHMTMEFFAGESCGKCAPCREGTRALLEMLARIARGRALPADPGNLRDISRAMLLASACGLGQTAPVSLLDCLDHFASEFESPALPAAEKAAVP